MILRDKLLAGSFIASVVINLAVVSALGWSRLSATPTPKKPTPEKSFAVYTPPKPNYTPPKPNYTPPKPKRAAVKRPTPKPAPVKPPKPVSLKPPVLKSNAPKFVPPKFISPKPATPKPVPPKSLPPKSKVKPTPSKSSKPTSVTPPKPPGKPAAFKAAKPKPKSAPKPPGKPEVRPPAKPKPPGPKSATHTPHVLGAKPSAPKPLGKNLTGIQAPGRTPPSRPKPPGGRPKTGDEHTPAKPGRGRDGRDSAARSASMGPDAGKHWHAPAAAPKARVLPKLKLGTKGPGRAKSAAAMKALTAKKAVVGRKAVIAKKAVGARKAVKSNKVVTAPKLSNLLPGARFKNGTIALPPSASKSPYLTAVKPPQARKPGRAAMPGRTGQTARVAEGAIVGRTGRAAVGKGVGSEELGGGDGNGLVGAYYEGANFERFRARRADARVEFDWWSKLPVPQMPPAVPYSVRWTGLVQPRFSGVYTFSTIADDGVRLWVNGQKIIDDWQIQPATEIKGAIALAAGQKYDIRLEFFEKNGTSIAKVFLFWASARQPREIVPESRLFQGRF